MAMSAEFQTWSESFEKRCQNTSAGINFISTWTVRLTSPDIPEANSVVRARVELHSGWWFEPL